MAQVNTRFLSAFLKIDEPAEVAAEILDELKTLDDLEKTNYVRHLICVLYAHRPLNTTRFDQVVSRLLSDGVLDLPLLMRTVPNYAWLEAFLSEKDFKDLKVKVALKQRKLIMTQRMSSYLLGENQSGFASALVLIQKVLPINDFANGGPTLLNLVSQLEDGKDTGFSYALNLEDSLADVARLLQANMMRQDISPFRYLSLVLEELINHLEDVSEAQLLDYFEDSTLYLGQWANVIGQVFPVGCLYQCLEFKFALLGGRFEDVGNLSVYLPVYQQLVAFFYKAGLVRLDFFPNIAGFPEDFAHHFKNLQTLADLEVDGELVHPKPPQVSPNESNKDVFPGCVGLVLGGLVESEPSYYEDHLNLLEFTDELLGIPAFLLELGYFTEAAEIMDTLGGPPAKLAPLRGPLINTFKRALYPLFLELNGETSVSPPKGRITGDYDKLCKPIHEVFDTGDAHDAGYVRDKGVASVNHAFEASLKYDWPTEHLDTSFKAKFLQDMSLEFGSVRLAHRQIGPGLGIVQDLESFTEFWSQVQKYLGVLMGADVEFMEFLSVIVRSFLQKSGDPSGALGLQTEMAQLLSISHLHGISSRQREAYWETLKELSTDQRVEIYAGWEAQMKSEPMEYEVLRNRVRKGTRRLLRRVVATEATKPNTEDALAGAAISQGLRDQFRYLTGCHPFVAFDELFKILENSFNGNLIVPYITLCSETCALHFDLLLLKFRKLLLTRDLSGDLCETPPAWFSNMSQFIAGLFLQLPFSQDHLLDFLMFINDELLNRPVLSFFLSAFISCVGGQSIVVDISEKQFPLLGAGPQMRYHRLESVRGDMASESKLARAALLKGLYQLLGLSAEPALNLLSLARKYAERKGAAFAESPRDDHEYANACKSYDQLLLFLSQLSEFLRIHPAVQGDVNVTQPQGPTEFCWVSGLLRHVCADQRPSSPGHPLQQLITQEWATKQYPSLSFELFRCFCQHTYSDLVVPFGDYTEMRASVQHECHRIDSALKSFDRTSNHPMLDRSLVRLPSLKEQVHRNQTLGELDLERDLYTQNFNAVFEEMRAALPSFSSPDPAEAQAALATLISQLMMPRIKLSMTDALYAVAFYRRLVALKFWGLNIFDFWIQFTKAIFQELPAASLREADLLGLCFRDVIMDTLHCRNDTYLEVLKQDNPCLDCHYYLPAFSEARESLETTHTQSAYLQMENFAIQKLTELLKSASHVDQHLGLTVLKRTAGVLPVSTNRVDEVLKLLIPLTLEETQSDFKNLGSAIHRQILGRTEFWTPPPDKPSEPKTELRRKQPSPSNIIKPPPAPIFRENPSQRDSNTQRIYPQNDRETRDPRDHRELRDLRDPRDQPRDFRDSWEPRDPRDARESRDNRDRESMRDNRDRDPRAQPMHPRRSRFPSEAWQEDRGGYYEYNRGEDRRRDSARREEMHYRTHGNPRLPYQYNDRPAENFAGRPGVPAGFDYHQMHFTPEPIPIPRPRGDFRAQGDNTDRHRRYTNKRASSTERGQSAWKSRGAEDSYNDRSYNNRDFQPKRRREDHDRYRNDK